MISLVDSSARSETTNTVRVTLEWAEAELERQGIEEPRLDAEHLLAHCLGIERWRLRIDGCRVLAPDERKIFRGLLGERLTRRPLAYILGWAGFYNLVLAVDERALIPRPETEVLVDRACGFLNESPVDRPDILDLGCGCGCVALSMAREYPDAVIKASDISSEALCLACSNADGPGIASGIIFREGDLFEPWEDCRETGFDLILVNPPYLSKVELAAAPPEVRRYEPDSALNGGEDGLAVIRRLILESPAYLKSGGRLLFEIGADQGKAVQAMVESAEDLVFSKIIKDYCRRDRVVEAIKISNLPTQND